MGNSTLRSLAQLATDNAFIGRHIGPGAADEAAMLSAIGASSLDQLLAETVPAAILMPEPPAMHGACDEQTALAELAARAGRNQIAKSYIGLGYHPTVTPPVILRNVLEDPNWYTAYTPYQPEVAQGRLQALLNYQQLVMDLTGMELANASLLDEATAAAEAMALARRVAKQKVDRFFVADDVLPQTLDVVRTRAERFGFELLIGPAADAGKQPVFGALFQYPGREGVIADLGPAIAAVQAQQGLAIVAADLLALLLLTPPGEMGADVVVGNSQRFGVPMGYGGPHAAFFATRDAFKRALPGRVIGVSRDRRGNVALRMAMQTREQHIRREKANSNICTSQVLLANVASFYAVYHGPAGLRAIAERVHRLTAVLAAGLAAKGFSLRHGQFFDTLTVTVSGEARTAILARARAAGINLRCDDPAALGISLHEAMTLADLVELFEVVLGAGHGLEIAALDAVTSATAIPAALLRQSAVLSHPVFNRYHSETEMLRYIERLARKDLALNHAMIPLGSCTMKLNATAEMIPITWPGFGQLHPFCPAEQAEGYRQMIDELGQWLVTLTGYDAVSMQPNSGAQGEYAGLLAIQRYHASRGDHHRTICLIPSSAHGTNPATAQMMGMQVVVVDCDKRGNVDLADLRAKAEQHSANLAAVMITYPSTHGVFEVQVSEICAIIHAHGGQVYLDGANLNAQVGVTSPGLIGADVSHINLHKTFCIPHGGGGPGMGPICVKAHLAPFLPGHWQGGELDGTNHAVSAAPFGSASILPISWMYIRMMGGTGLRKATAVAILAANYVASRLAEAYPVLYTGEQGRVAHECIIDLRPLKAVSGISEMDLAKRLIDYGFHAPTMSFPVAGTLMIEPTESESKAELDRFIDAMLAIRGEIDKVIAGEWPLADNPLVNAPHTQADLADSDWNHPYSRELACFPSEAVKASKVWPAVNRLDDVYGDRNLFCACVPMSDYAEA
ncbi:MAG: aminomethyl-transferring glycine dehydrogenase [Gammaproteobacteria bacterium]|nr:aminomethyl-transferring glycine dehydrogenase [Gammaproteobacteria bacterium]